MDKFSYRNILTGWAVNIGPLMFSYLSVIDAGNNNTSDTPHDHSRSRFVFEIQNVKIK